jgi:hypothetical protein
MRCPTLEDITTATLALLPRGRAWQTNEGGPRAGSVIGFNPDAFDPGAFSTSESNPSILYLYFRSFAVVLHYLTQRLCALREEFWCSSVVETRDEWMTEYGLPDACDPFPDLCTKVIAIGGTRCEYYAEVAARSGWSITCKELVASCGSRAGFVRAGKAKTGATLFNATLQIVVSLPDSPAYQPRGRFTASRAGRLRGGRRLSCGPDLGPLQCIMARIVHAEIYTLYEVRGAVT